MKNMRNKEKKHGHSNDCNLLLAKQQPPYQQMFNASSPIKNAYIPEPTGASAKPETATGSVNYRAVKVEKLCPQIPLKSKAVFFVNTQKAGHATLGVSVTGPDYNIIDNKMLEGQSGIHEVSFTPTVAGEYNVSICFAGMNIKDSPFKVNAVDFPKPKPRSNSEIQPTTPSPIQHSNSVHETTIPLTDDIHVLDMLSPQLRERINPHHKPLLALELGKVLGEGQYGFVYEVRVKFKRAGATLYAAKSLKEINKIQLEEFFNEADLMSNFHHENVLPLQGIVICNGRPYILFPIMEHGNLKEYLHKSKDLPYMKLLDMISQVANGMEYISNLKFVHRDLAARNCLLNGDGVVKISDFGLARDNFLRDYVMINTHKKLPIRWIAPDVLETFKFTSESDVWAFGVLSWEVFTLGDEPYQEVEDSLLKLFLNNGKRLRKPEKATDEIYELMLSCWNIDSEKRPNFTTLAYKLNDFRETERRFSDSYKNPVTSIH